MIEIIAIILFLYVLSGLFSKDPKRRKSAQVAANSGGFIRIATKIIGIIIGLIVLSALGG